MGLTSWGYYLPLDTPQKYQDQKNLEKPLEKSNDLDLSLHEKLI
jgi:hypothetical protein